MKNFILKNKIIILLISIIIILSISLFATCFGMDSYEAVNYDYGIVNTEYLNMRTGSGIDFAPVTILKKNEYVRIFAKIGQWYIIQNQANQIGTVHSDYIIPTNEQKASSSNTEIITENEFLDLTKDENELLSLINTERSKNNLSALQIDKELQNVYDKIKHICNNLNKYINIITSNTFSHAFKKCRVSLVKILKKILPRKLAGNIYFGTGDPSSTGKFMGYYSMIYPYISRELNVFPDFENKIAKIAVFLFFFSFFFLSTSHFL